MENSLHIFRKITQSGIEIKIKNKKYQIDYPHRIWNKFPKSLHKIFADSLTYIATWQLPLTEKKDIVYHFSHPFIEPIFFKILIYSIPMSIYEIENALTSEVIKQFYNSHFHTQFKAVTDHFSGRKVKRNLKEKALLLFSFGKESLLTYGLLEELGVTPVPFFMREPKSPYENAHKRKLANRFASKIGREVNFIPLSFGRLRQEEDLYWGWDILLSQYVFTLIPYYYFHQAKYLFLGGEQSCNFYTKDSEGYLINPVFEQSVTVLQLLGNIPELFSIGTHIGSLVEPIHEIFITYLLHRRYSEIGKFQMSCFSEEPEAKKSRWCGHCEKCARMYIFFKALNINPERVGFYNNHMLDRSKKNLYAIFGHSEVESAYGGSGLGQDEQLLAFYLAYKNGVKGELINDFVSLHLKKVERRKNKLIKEYFGVYSSCSLPSSLRRRTLKIFEKERENLLNYCKKLVR